jgi:hypothetical protein
MEKKKKKMMMMKNGTDLLEQQCNNTGDMNSNGVDSVQLAPATDSTSFSTSQLLLLVHTMHIIFNTINVCFCCVQ